ncbi:anthranilate phosphoribosyl transferase [Trichococcus palustris]|uniref:Anthranilate phosphoribosyltransferase n=1 Tax=Trichococcus palustris TaxID=140314 RepID=A0A143YG97_9LACT|nr:anthranilate phosphoribosyltransferase [Trichococcus palustris]CZQ88873.1 anthranilate phosphoribosyl transferase [Trichococcus palustris]SFL00566.1 anthranilate phosphoribosyltransferase [Trichococcus palustris]
MLKNAIKKIAEKKDLSALEAAEAMKQTMSGACEPSQVGAFLLGLRMKGETPDEIEGSAYSLLENAVAFDVPSEDNGMLLIDTCGTGGDEANTFNISTAAAIIASAAGVKVAKHGNRAVSSLSGSADILQELGVHISAEMDDAKECLKETGMTFLFAQKYHPAMKNAAKVRGELGTRTIFNLLGPLINPAPIKGQVLGVYDGRLTHTIAEVLLRMGRERALVVHGTDGLDEITTTGATLVTEVRDGQLFDYTIHPSDFGVAVSNKADIKGGSAAENAVILEEVLKGKKGPQRDIVLLNTAAALYVGKAVNSLQEGVLLAAELIDTGRAYEQLKKIVNFGKRSAVNDIR